MPRRVGKKDPTKWSEPNHDKDIPRYVKERVIRDAGNRCNSCRNPHVLVGTGHIDHILRLQDQQPGDPERHCFGNLQYLCQVCHNNKTAEENTDAAKGRRIFAKTYGITKSERRRKFNRWTKKPKPKQGYWEPYDFDDLGVPKRSRWVAPEKD
jgi:hypothetical protein